MKAIQEARAGWILAWVSVAPVVDPRQVLAWLGNLMPWGAEWKTGKPNHRPAAKQVDWSGLAAAVHAPLAGSGKQCLIQESGQL